LSSFNHKFMYTVHATWWQCKVYGEISGFKVCNWNRYSAATFKFYWAVHPIHCRREINGHLAFLDLNVHRTVEGKLETDVYRKPTHTDWNICHTTLITHAVSHKISVAKTLLQRAESLPSNSDSQANEREYVLNVLGENDYPKRFLNDCLRSPVCRNQNNSEHRTNQENIK
jgi:hypothetical protein